MLKRLAIALILLVYAMCMVADAKPLAKAGRKADGAFDITDGRDLAGMVRTLKVKRKDKRTFYEYARDNGLGYGELVDANPGVDPWVPDAGTKIILPKRWVLPPGPREGVVVNLAEMRLYYYFPANGRRMVRTYPIGVAREGYETPQGEFTITSRTEKPNWYPPKALREADPELPAIVPPGKDNPLGEYAVQLSKTDFFLHGTNLPYGIGYRVSHGCIRLYPEDIKALFYMVRAGMPVRIIYEPVKLGVLYGDLYIEVHKDYKETAGDLEARTRDMLSLRPVEIDEPALMRALKEMSGMPVKIGKAVREPWPDEGWE